MIQNGVVIEMTPEMMEAFDAEMAAIEVPEPEPSPEERIAALENQLASYEAAYAEGVKDA